MPAERIRRRVAAGFDAFGENRVQERAAKAPRSTRATCCRRGATLAPRRAAAVEQGPPGRRAVRRHRDRRLARARRGGWTGSRARSRPGRPLPVLLQVNVDADAGEVGLRARATLERDLPAILDLPDLAVDGLMTVGRLVDDAEAARPTFVALRELSRAAASAATPASAPSLSMGMSEDYAVAVEEGATLVRIGRRDLRRAARPG